MWTARACGAASPPRSSRSTVYGRRSSGYHPVHCGPVDELIPLKSRMRDESGSRLRDSRLCRRPAPSLRPRTRNGGYGNK